VAGAGDGDVAEAGVEQVRVDAGIGMDEDAFGSEALGAVPRRSPIVTHLCAAKVTHTKNSVWAEVLLPSP
jgi:hypothetical protein